MVAVVHFDDQVGDGQLQLMRPQAARLVVRHQPQARPEKQQDVGGLADQQIASLQVGRRERRAAHSLVFQEVHQRRQTHAAVRRAARDIDIIGAGLLQRQPDEFAAPLDFGQ